MFIINFNKRGAQKLHRIILLHFGLVTFRFHLGTLRKVIIFMIFGPRGHVHDSQNQLFLTLVPANYFNELKKTPNSSFEKHLDFGILRSQKKCKDACQEILEIRLTNSSES